MDGVKNSASVVDSDAGSVEDQLANTNLDADDGLEFQIALDQMVTVTSMEPMNTYLARQRGLDPRSTKMVMSEYRGDWSEMTELGSVLSYIGNVDGFEIPKKLI